jgi:hypothetical protein
MWDGSSSGSHGGEFEDYCLLGQRYSNFFVRVPPDIISLQLFTPKVVGT